MSPYPSAVESLPGEFDGSGITLELPVVAAGHVIVPMVPPDPELRVWILRAEPSLRADVGGEMARLELAETGSQIAMPAGRVIAGLWDRRRQGFRALGRPLGLDVGGTVTATFDVPEGVGHLLLRLERSLPPTAADDLDVELWLEDPAGKGRPADLVVPTAESVHAVWYDVSPGPGYVRGGSRDSGVSPTPFDVRAGEVAYRTGALVPRPRLDVELDLPAALARDDLTLEVRRLADDSLVATEELKPGTRSAVFAALPLDVLRLDLKCEVGTFDETVDLRDGSDRHVLLSPEVISLHGRVYYGDDPHPARIELGTVERKTIATTTDHAGRYAVALLEPVRFISVLLEGSAVSPYTDFFPRAIDSSRELDFHLSDVILRVRVVDATTNQGIPEARVGVRATIAGTGGGAVPGSDPADSNDKIVQRLSSDEAGEVILPPPRKGVLEVYARADGYQEIAEPLTIPVGDDLADAEYRLALVPVGDTATLRLRLPNGAEAAGAQVTVLDSLSGAARLLMATADGAGDVDLPRALDGKLLLVTHPDAAFLIEEWRPAPGEESVTRRLPARAPRPLRIEVLDSTGEELLPFANVALWVDGVRLQHGVLTLITGTPSQTDGGGSWVGVGLPPTAVAAAATRLPEDARGGLEALATSVSYPWPDPVTIRAIE